jgi:putative DNA primase/helicase
MVSKLNEWADLWFYDIGANVIPSDTRIKKTNFRWSYFKDKPISIEEHEAAKENGGYENGISIMAGHLHRGDNKGQFLVCIDIDKIKGIEEFLPHLKVDTLEQLAEKTIVEQHLDNKEKAQVYFLSLIAFPNIGPNSELGLEIKSQGEHGIMFCTPSIHPSGQVYQIIGTKKPALLNSSEAILMIQYIDSIFKKNGLLYIEKKSRLNEKLKRAIKNLKIPKSLNGTIKEGERHLTLISVANSILFNHYKNDDNIDELKDFFVKVNKNICYPESLPSQEIDSIWESAVLFVKQNKNFDNNMENAIAHIKKRKTTGEEAIELAVEVIMKNHYFITIEESKEILYYVNEVYIPGGDILIETLSESMFERGVSNGSIGEIKGHIKRNTYSSLEKLDKDINIINLQNGLYDINKNELKPHTPYYHSINQIPVKYDSNAKSKSFGKFFSEVLYPAEIRTAIEVMAYTFWRDCPFEYYFKLHGYGANGKSVFTSLLTKLHGLRNVSNVSLLSLINNRFALSDLANKSVNIDTELSTTIIKDTSLLKKLTGGRRQPIRIEQKYHTLFDIFLYAKLFFNANTIIESADQTAANYRREIIISFPNTFEGKKADPRLLDKLTTEEELSGIFNVLMQALRNILKNKGIYLNEKTIEEKTLKHERAVNHIKCFISEAIVDEGTESDYVIKSDLFESYKKYCKIYSLAPKSIEAFGRDLKKLNW